MFLGHLTPIPGPFFFFVNSLFSLSLYFSSCKKGHDGSCTQIRDEDSWLTNAPVLWEALSPPPVREQSIKTLPAMATFPPPSKNQCDHLSPKVHPFSPHLFQEMASHRMPSSLTLNTPSSSEICFNCPLAPLPIFLNFPLESLPHFQKVPPH